MKCTCREDIEEKLLERFKEQAPEAQEHSVSLQGYNMYLVGNGLVTYPSMKFETTALFPLKKGGTKKKTTDLMIRCNYCPFCGKYVEKEEAAA